MDGKAAREPEAVAVAVAVAVLVRAKKEDLVEPWIAIFANPLSLVLLVPESVVAQALANGHTTLKHSALS